MELNVVMSTVVIIDQAQKLVTEVPSIEKILKIPTLVSSIQHEIDLILGSSLTNLSQFSAKHTQIL